MSHGEAGGYADRRFYDIPLGHKHYPFVLGASERCIAEAKQYPNVCHCPFGKGYRIQYTGGPGEPLLQQTLCNKCNKYCKFRLEQQDECRELLHKLDKCDFDSDKSKKDRIKNVGEWIRPDGRVFLKHTPAKHNYGQRYLRDQVEEVN